MDLEHCIVLVSNCRVDEYNLLLKITTHFNKSSMLSLNSHIKSVNFIYQLLFFYYMALEFIVQDLQKHLANALLKQTYTTATAELEHGVTLRIGMGNPSSRPEYGLYVQLSFTKKSKSSGLGNLEESTFGTKNLSELYQLLDTILREQKYVLPDLKTVPAYNNLSFSNGKITCTMSKISDVGINFSIPLYKLEELTNISKVAEFFQVSYQNILDSTQEFINKLYSSLGEEVNRKITLVPFTAKEEVQRVMHEVGAKKDGLGIEDMIAVRESPIEQISWDDVGGLADQKKELMQVAAAMRKGMYKLYGIKPKSGYLFVGATGNGKTYTARAFAANAGLAFYEVTMGDLSKPLVGLSEAYLAALHKEAFKKPSIIFIDEIEGFTSFDGEDRTKSSPLAALRYWMSQAANNETPVIYIATTTDEGYSRMNPQFLRRFTDHMKFMNPTVDEKATILEIHAKRIAGKAANYIEIFAADLDYRRIAAAITNGSRDKTAKTVQAVVEQMVAYHLERNEPRDPIATRDYLYFLEHNKLPMASLRQVQ